MAQKPENNVQRIYQRFFDITEGLDWFEKEAAVDRLDDKDPDKTALWECFIDAFFYQAMQGFLRYNLKEPLFLPEYLPLLERLLKRTGNTFLAAYLAMLEHNEKKCVANLKKALAPDGATEPLNEWGFSQLVVAPFKNAIPGLYKKIRPILDTTPTEESVKALCDVLDAYYATTDPDEMAELLYPLVQKFPDSVLANTLMAVAQYETKHWGSAIAYFEKVEDFDQFLLFFPDDIYFFKGWAYSKLNEHVNSIKCYEKALESNPAMEDALNNMGWEYYRLKKYSQALEIFQRCLAEGRDLDYAPNNVVRNLLAMKRYKDAKEFVKNCPHKIAKDLVRKVQAASSTNAKYQEVEAAPQSSGKIASGGSTGEQFSSERILEEELCARIEAGTPVFGKKLKIYRRRGAYGRQFIIPIGRLDLLAEDEEGNLYIIELKKDRGYDDPYVQITTYLDWFEKHFNHSKRIYGIICLNDPTEGLKAAVHGDKRVRLFNYSISYHEV